MVTSSQNFIIGKKYFRPIGYFQAKIEIDHSKFETCVSIIRGSSINVDINIGIDILHQGTLSVSGNVVKILKYQNDSKNSLIDLINVSEVTVNSKFNAYYSSLKISNR